jgi:hypothetical protein
MLLHLRMRSYLSLFLLLFFCYSCNSEKKKETFINTEEKNLLKIYACYAPGGQTIYFSYNGTIYLSEKKDKIWSQPIPIKGLQEFSSENQHPAISPDGMTLYFSSNTPAGFGGFDIYIASLIQKDSLDKILNIGPSINTTADEIMPYESRDGLRFYFSTTGHQGIGKFDVFESTKLKIGWQIPENMIDINDEKDNFLYEYFINEGFADTLNYVPFDNSFVLITNTSFQEFPAPVYTTTIEIKESTEITTSKSKTEYINNEILQYNDIKIDSLHFEIQIGAGKDDFHRPETITQFGELIIRETETGLKRFSVGKYYTLSELEKHKKLVIQHGYIDAFSVYYYKGEKINMNETHRLLKNNSK